MPPTRTPRPCIGCGTPSLSTRCRICEQQRQSKRNQARPHYKGDWPTISRRYRAEHVARHGWVCPGWDRPPHPSTDLVTDHVNPRDPTRVQVLCRSCNSRKSVHERTKPS